MLDSRRRSIKCFTNYDTHPHAAEKSLGKISTEHNSSHADHSKLCLQRIKLFKTRNASMRTMDGQWPAQAQVQALASERRPGDHEKAQATISDCLTTNIFCIGCSRTG